MISTKKRKSDRRKYKRLDFHAKAFLLYCNERISCTITNISCSGAFVDTNRMFELNDPIELVILVTRGKNELSMHIPGKIARIAGKGIGFASPHMSVNQVLQLELILQYNQNNPKALVNEFCKLFVT